MLYRYFQVMHNIDIYVDISSEEACKQVHIHYSHRSSHQLLCAISSIVDVCFVKQTRTAD